MLRTRKKLVQIRDRCLSDPVSLAAFVARLVDKTFVFSDFHAEWMKFVTAPAGEGQALRMLLAPRTHGKSTIANLCAVIDRILHDRNARILIASETDLQASGFVGHLRQVLEHPVFMSVFGDLRSDNWSKSHGLTVSGRTQVLKEPTVMARSAGSALPSYHFDMIVLDDVIDDDDVHTEAQRKAASDWYYETLEPTLTKDGTLLVIGTRWHYFDLYGALIESGGYSVKRYQAVRSWSPRTDLWDAWTELATAPDGDSQQEAQRFLEDHREEMYEGTEVLLPEVWPYEKLMFKRARSGSIIFAKQYQNDPSLGEGSQILKPTDFRYYSSEDLPGRDEFVCVVSAYDLAISQKEQADYTAVVTVGVMEDGKIYVLKAHRGHIGFDEQIALIRNTNAEFREDEVVIEAVQYQQALADVVKRWTAIPVRPYHPPVDKVTRALKVQPQIEQHRVLFHHSQRSLIQEMAEFPYSEHDDQVDAFTSAVSRAVELSLEMLKRRKKKRAALYI